MANYKRKRPRNGGCLRCKPQKLNGQKPWIAKTIGEKRADLKVNEPSSRRARRTRRLRRTRTSDSTGLNHDARRKAFRNRSVSRRAAKPDVFAHISGSDAVNPMQTAVSILRRGILWSILMVRTRRSASPVAFGSSNDGASLIAIADGISRRSVEYKP
jgi:hypothetical protein